MKKIPLTQGQVAIVDDEDYERLMDYKWRVTKSPSGYYANRTVHVLDVKRRRSKSTTISMAAAVIGQRPGWRIDHRTGNTLDNRRKNLRHATGAQNDANRRPKEKRRWKGVAHHKGKFEAAAGPRGNVVYLGRFETAEEAARAYDRKAKELYGEFARLNFP